MYHSRVSSQKGIAAFCERPNSSRHRNSRLTSTSTATKSRSSTCKGRRNSRLSSKITTLPRQCAPSGGSCGTSLAPLSGSVSSVIPWGYENNGFAKRTLFAQLGIRRGRRACLHRRASFGDCYRGCAARDDISDRRCAYFRRGIFHGGGQLPLRGIG